MTDEHPHAHGNVAEIRVPKLRTPMALLLMVIVLTVMWGWTNRAKNDEILRRLDTIDKKLDAISQIDSE